jgi:iron complex outermembrane receptor protein
MFGSKFLGTASLLVLAWPAAASAQQAGPAATKQPAARQEAVSSDDVVVTATRRETSVQDVPSSILALSGAELETRRVTSVSELAATVPALSFFSFGSTRAYLSMRGAYTNDASPAVDQAVAVFVDDVVSAGTADSILDFYDLDHIEVLRGPQGTLFGRNVTGGALMLNTLVPKFHTEARAQLTGGSYGTVEARALITGPLSDSVAGKLSGGFERNDSSYYSAIDGRRQIGRERYSLRGQLLWNASADLKVRVGFDYLKDKSGMAPIALLANFQPTLYPEFVFNPQHVNYAQRFTNDHNVFGAFGRLDWNLGVGTLTSISGYRNVDSVAPVMSTGSNVSTNVVSDKNQQFTQEIRLASPADQRVTWIVGGYYLTSSRKHAENITFAFRPGTSLSAAYPSQNIQAIQAQNVDIDSKALFGELGLNLTPQLNVSVGGRYTWERKQGDSRRSPGNLFTTPGVTATFGKSWHAFTPRAVVTWKPASDLMFFATVSKGFRSGAFNFTGSNAAALAAPVNPEYVWNYELGTKAELFDRALLFNASVYQMDFTDLQVRQFNPDVVSFTLLNAGKARTRGVDIEATLRPVPHFSISGLYSYQDARYREYLLRNAAGVVTDDFSGKRVAITPQHSFTGTAQYEVDLGASAGKLSLRGDVRYRSSYWTSERNNDSDFIHDRTPLKGAVDLRVTWTSGNGNWDLSVWGKNVNNLRFIQGAADATSLHTTPAEVASPFVERLYIVSWNEPRTVGVTLNWHWR